MRRTVTQKDIDDVMNILGDFIPPAKKKYLTDEVLDGDEISRQEKLSALKALLAQFRQNMHSSVQTYSEAVTKEPSTQNQLLAVTLNNIESRLDQIDKKLDKILRRLDDISDKLQG